MTMLLKRKLSPTRPVGYLNQVIYLGERLIFTPHFIRTIYRGLFVACATYSSPAWCVSVMPFCIRGTWAKRRAVGVVRSKRKRIHYTIPKATNRSFVWYFFLAESMDSYIKFLMFCGTTHLICFGDNLGFCALSFV